LISLAKLAVVKVMTAAAPISPDYITQSLEEWLPDASAAGIISVFDVGTILPPEEAGYELYNEGAVDLSRPPKRTLGQGTHHNAAMATPGRF